MPRSDTGSSLARTDPGELKQRFDAAFADADASRLAGLTYAQTVHAARAATLEREHARIAAKYGGKSPEALEAERRLAVQTSLVGNLAADAARAAVAPFGVADGAAVIHGFVILPGFTGVADAEVSAVGDKRASAGRGDTDSRGYFKIAFAIASQGRGGGGAATSRAGVQPGSTVRLEVVQNGKVVLRDEQELTLDGGRAVYRELLLPAGSPRTRGAPGGRAKPA